MKIADKLAEILVIDGIIDSSEKDVYSYGVELFALKSFAFVLAIIISLILNTTTILISYLLFFVPIRKYSGGIHASSARKCMIISEILLIVCCEVIKFIHIKLPIAIIMLTASIILIIITSPDASENKPLSDKQMRKYKKYVVVVCLITMISFVAMLMKKESITVSTIVVAYLLQAILLLISKIRNGIRKKANIG